MLNTMTHNNRIKDIAMDWKQIGQQIKAQRKRRGLSQQELGKKIGATNQYISQLENGYPCSVKLLNKIAEALDCDLEVRFISHNSTN